MVDAAYGIERGDAAPPPKCRLSGDWSAELRREIRALRLTRAQVCVILNIKPDRLAQWLVSRRARKANPCPYWAVELLALKGELAQMGIEVPDVAMISDEEAAAEEAELRRMAAMYRPGSGKIGREPRATKERAPRLDRRP